MSADDKQVAVLAEEIEAWVRGPGEEYAEEIERTRQVPPKLREELRERGWLRLAAPVEYGGHGLRFPDHLRLMELFSMSHASIRMIVHVANGVWRAIDQFATDCQREQFVLPQIAGDINVAFTLTEPTAGTGADLRSTVTRERDTYYLSGEKHLITFGVNCDYWLLFARLEGTTGKDGTVALMVSRNVPGVTVNPMAETMGVRGTDHAHLVFDRAPVPVANRLGEEGRGLEVALGGFLTPSRISVAMTCVGLARRAQELAVAHAKSRVTFGKPLAARQAISFQLAENATDIEAGRQLTLHAARQWEAGAAGDTDAAAAADSLSSMAKLNAVDMLTRVTDKALQVHGGIGFWETSPIERVYRDARAQRFEEGTNEIQKTIIARTVLG
jgi:alkylation response protein AidB-like acyl-CoA dehydrogenase